MRAGMRLSRIGVRLIDAMMSESLPDVNSVVQLSLDYTMIQQEETGAKDGV